MSRFFTPNRAKMAKDYLSRTSKSDGTGKRLRRARYTPQLEVLENRTLFSTLTVLNNFDSGAGSLRADIAAAHKGDTIAFAPSVLGQTITLTKGELLINKNLTIAGPGAGELTVSGNHSSRVFEVPTGTQVTLTGLTISNGLADAGNGGGILNSGTLTVSGSTLAGNAAVFEWKGNKGVGGFGGGIYDSGTLTVSGGTILSGNSASSGAGISNSVTGTVSLSGSTLSGNSASNGGGILNSGTLTVTGSTLSGNSASSGAGIWNGGTPTVSGGTLTVTGSTLSNNVASSVGGGIANFGTGTVSVSGSTFSGNSATSNNGGGIFVAGGTLTLSGSTLIGNAAGHYGGGIYIGYYVTATASGSTLTGNSAAQGGGIWNDGRNALTVENSSSITGNFAPVGSGADVYNVGVVYVDGSSIIGVLDGTPAVAI